MAENLSSSSTTTTIAATTTTTILNSNNLDEFDVLNNNDNHLNQLNPTKINLNNNNSNANNGLKLRQLSSSSIINDLQNENHHQQNSNQNQNDFSMKNLVKKAENYEQKMFSYILQQTKFTTNKLNLKHFNNLPNWLQDNDYLFYGHRPPMESFKDCFLSIFHLHTETMNIWTHAIGCISFIIISLYLFLASSYANIPTIDKIMLGIFLLTAILCLAFSTCYHTLACHSEKVLLFVCKLDYCGISLLIAGSIVPCLYYAFYCSFFAQIFYSCLTIALCAAIITVSFVEKFSESQYRPLRATLFTAFAFSSFIPAVHWFWKNSNDKYFLNGSFQTAIICLILMAFLYILGALVYALRIPECFYPGKFDFYFHSHQLFHIFVILAAICHLRGITSMADVRLFDQQSICIN